MPDPFTDTRDPLVKAMARTAAQASVDKAVAAERDRIATMVEGLDNTMMSQVKLAAHIRKGGALIDR
jgi:hypothetical protein